LPIHKGENMANSDAEPQDNAEFAPSKGHGKLAALIPAGIASHFIIQVLQNHYSWVYDYAQFYGGLNPEAMNESIAFGLFSFFVWLSPHNLSDAIKAGILYVKSLDKLWRS